MTEGKGESEMSIVEMAEIISMEIKDGDDFLRPEFLENFRPRDFELFTAEISSRANSLFCSFKSSRVSGLDCFVVIIVDVLAKYMIEDACNKYHIHVDELLNNIEAFELVDKVAKSAAWDHLHEVD
jgi:hypothetical protein